MKVTVFGAGYVGLVQAAVFAESGADVTCVDLDPKKVERLRRGESVIFEPGLSALISEGIERGRLRFTTDAEEGVSHGAIIFIAVGTPPDEDGAADLSHVLAVAATISRYMIDERLIVIKSTVPVGTNDKVRAAITDGLNKRGLGHLAFDVASNPEFLKEGSAVADCSRPDRIIIGTASERSEALLRQLYAPFNRNHQKVIVMDARSAELTKYAANCILATKISFMNEIANLADRLGADVENVRLGIGSDPRIGYDFIYPGMGYGGSCFPKDVKAMIHLADEIAFDAVVLKAVEERNKHQKSVLVDKILAHFDGDIRGRTFALWGLSFKPNTDDMREAPARVVMEALWDRGATIRAFDPKAMEECERLYPDRADLVLCSTQQAALEGADALVICTEWKAFRTPDFSQLKRMLKSPVIFDGRNMYDPQQLSDQGFVYQAVGRSARPADEAPEHRASALAH